MTTWLQRQEALVRQDSYLSWALREDGLNSGADLTDEGAASEDDMAEDEPEDKEGDEDEDENEDKEHEDSAGRLSRSEESDAEEAAFKTLKSLLNSNVRRAYHVPLSPSDKRISLPELHTQYRAPGFLAALHTFLDTHLPTATRPNEFDTYDVFHYINILKPAVRHFDNSKRICKVRASPVRPRIGTRRAAPAHFDCGLFVVDAAKHKTEGGLNGTLRLTSSLLL